jgi:hypothetical protein
MLENSEKIYEFVLLILIKSLSFDEKESSFPKGQIISKCLFGAIVSTKKPTIFF